MQFRGWTGGRGIKGTAVRGNTADYSTADASRRAQSNTEQKNIYENKKKECEQTEYNENVMLKLRCARNGRKRRKESLVAGNDEGLGILIQFWLGSSPVYIYLV